MGELLLIIIRGALTGAAMELGRRAVSGEWNEEEEWAEEGGDETDD